MKTVVAMQLGFHGGTRRRVGDVFNMDETKWKQKDGKPVPPKWVQVVANANEGRAVAQRAEKAAADKLKAGAIAASGGKAAKDKTDATAEQLAG
jgi:hypothetical protein